ncbi:hypothetical protein BC832DRAFT_369426 [Gaertneriomyces semiglobifer]|nr:hypothetical protein BC832DRAFT_369426 [Gaertneriomyces semiglobifer]
MMERMERIMLNPAVELQSPVRRPAVTYLSRFRHKPGPSRSPLEKKLGRGSYRNKNMRPFNGDSLGVETDMGIATRDGELDPWHWDSPHDATRGESTGDLKTGQITRKRLRRKSDYTTTTAPHSDSEELSKPRRIIARRTSPKPDAQKTKMKSRPAKREKKASTLMNTEDYKCSSEQPRSGIFSVDQFLHDITAKRRTGMEVDTPKAESINTLGIASSVNIRKHLKFRRVDGESDAKYHEKSKLQCNHQDEKMPFQSRGSNKKQIQFTASTILRSLEHEHDRRFPAGRTRGKKRATGMSKATRCRSVAAPPEGRLSGIGMRARCDINYCLEESDSDQRIPETPSARSPLPLATYVPQNPAQNDRPKHIKRPLLDIVSLQKASWDRAITKRGSMGGNISISSRRTGTRISRHGKQKKDSMVSSGKTLERPKDVYPMKPTLSAVATSESKRQPDVTALQSMPDGSGLPENVATLRSGPTDLDDIYRLARQDTGASRPQEVNMTGVGAKRHLGFPDDGLAKPRTLPRAWESQPHFDAWFDGTFSDQ